MADRTGENGLIEEARRLAAYLGCPRTDPRVLERYSEFHRNHAARLPATEFDERIIELARRSRVFLRLADAYTSRFRPDSLLRLKLVLVLALLETASESGNRLDQPASGSPPTAWVSLLVRGFSEGVILGVSVVVLGPLALRYRGRVGP